MPRCAIIFLVMAALLAGCPGRPAGDSAPEISPLPGELAYARRGDEIMVCGQFFHAAAPVVLWLHPGGYDAYRVERRFAPPDKASWKASEKELATPNRYGTRLPRDASPELRKELRERGWTLERLRQHVDLLVLHYDATGTSSECFRVLHDVRGLSAHFMIDVDGTVYQTLDLKERAWHAGHANDRSIGIELANLGACDPADAARLAELDAWYPEKGGTVSLRIPDAHRPLVRQGDTPLSPARPQRIEGRINGRRLVQHDFTRQQYDSLINLTRALRRIFPNLREDFPQDAAGRIRMDRPLTPAELADYRGILGHHHISHTKVDPGPAFQWDKLRRP